MKTKMMVLSLVFAGLLLASNAFAGPLGPGVVGVGNSWTFTFQNGNIGPFDSITATVTAGSPFDAPLALGQSWTSTLFNSTTVYGSGPTTSVLDVMFNFADPKLTPTIVEWRSYLNGVELEHWQYNDLSTNTNSLEGWTQLQVPEPGLALLLAIGLGVVGLLAGRIR